MKINVQTPDREISFDCAGEERLLHAALRNGVALPYECATGTCGICKGRAENDDVTALWDDAPGNKFLNTKKGEFLLCQAVPNGDCTLRVSSSVGLMSKDQFLPGACKGKVKQVGDLTNDTKLLEIRTDQPISYNGGQFVLVKTPEVSGYRAYSFAGYEPSTNSLKLIIRKKPDGRLTDWLFGKDRTGSELDLFGPLGIASLCPGTHGNIMCIAGGSGISATMSILEHAAATSHFNRFRGDIFFGVRTAEDTYLLEEFSRYVSSYPSRLRVTIALSDSDIPSSLRDAFPKINFETGFVHEVAGRSMENAFDGVTAFLAGPPPMVDGAIRMLLIKGRVPATSILYDKFG